MSAVSNASSEYTPASPSSWPLSRPHVKNLLHILRSANTRYSQLAAKFRANLHPTHHARKRAAALRLQVSTQAAKKLDYKQVSVVPLPVLETASPSDSEAEAESEARVTRPGPAVIPRIVAPIPRRAAEHAIAHLEKEREIKRGPRPVLRCSITAAALHVPQEASIVSGISAASSTSAYSNVYLTPASALRSTANERSRWSCTTIDQDEVMDVETDMEVPEVSIEHSPTDEQFEPEAYSSDYSPSMDLPVTAETDTEMDARDEEEEDEAYASLRPRMSLARGRGYTRAASLPVPRPRVPRARQNGRVPPTLDVPIDVKRLSWSSDIGCLSASSSQSSASALLTPEDNTQLVVRMKRKSASLEMDDEQDVAMMAEDSSLLEKRPKYGRKEWVVPASSERRAYPRKF